MKIRLRKCHKNSGMIYIEDDRTSKGNGVRILAEIHENELIKLMGCINLDYVYASKSN